MKQILMLLATLSTPIASSCVIGQEPNEDQFLIENLGRVSARKLFEPDKELEKAAEVVRRSCFRIEGRERGFLVDSTVQLGSAFVVSKKHRLVATSAAVSDALTRYSEVTLVAERNGTRFQIDRIYLSHSVKRQFDIGLRGRSSDPRDGDIAKIDCDVAILHLSESDKELPDELTLTTTDKQSLNDKSKIGIIQAIAIENVDELVRDHPVPARASYGGFETGITPNRVRQTPPHIPGDYPGTIPMMSACFDWTEHLAASSYGGPLFQADAAVFGICSVKSLDANMLRVYFATGEEVQGVMAENGLSGQRIDDDKQKKFVDDTVRARKARQMIREATRHISQREFRRAEQLCTEAIVLFPTYKWALFRRAEARIRCCEAEWLTLSNDEKITILKAADTDIRRSDLTSSTLELPIRQYGFRNRHAAILVESYGNAYLLSITHDLKYANRVFSRTVPIVKENAANIKALTDIKPERDEFGIYRLVQECLLLHAFLIESTGRKEDAKEAENNYELAVTMCPQRARALLILSNYWARKGNHLLEERVLRAGVNLTRTEFPGSADTPPLSIESAKTIREAKVGGPQAVLRLPEFTDVECPMPPENDGTSKTNTSIRK
jgi:hypothetical protein